MKTKLTLRIDERLIDSAKKYSKSRGKSLSELVSAFFDSLENLEEKVFAEVSPRTASLKGIISRYSAKE